MEKMLLGYSNALPIYVAMDERANNRSITILGCSGSGKSTTIYRMERQVANRNHKIIEIDFSDSSIAKNHLVEKSRLIDIKQNSIVSPLIRHNNVYGVAESSFDYAKRLSRLLTGIFRFGVNQENFLYDIIQEIATKNKNITLFDIYNALDISIPCCSVIRLRLKYLVDEKVFVNYETSGWTSLFEHDRPLQILNLSGFPVEERKVIAELLLDDLKSYLIESGVGKQNFILVLDECQNLRLTLNMPTAFFLSQGRKYGCGVWLATQSPEYFQKSELAQLYQSALVLNFQPNIEEAMKICRKLEDNEKERQRLFTMFKALKRGQCVASGQFLKKDGTLSNRGHLLVNCGLKR